MSEDQTQHPDFSAEWCQTLLGSGDVEILQQSLTAPIQDGSPSHNSMFARTLNGPHAIRAQVLFRRRPSPEPSAIQGAAEYCYLLSLGHGLDGLMGRAHGGLHALVLDNTTGVAASYSTQTQAPATVSLYIDFKAPISTPCVIVSRAWVTELKGRKIWLSGRIEDGMGGIFSTCKAFYIGPRTDQKL